VRGTVLYGPRDIRFEERTAPTIMKPTDAIIRITATYVCGSHLWPYSVERRYHSCSGCFRLERLPGGTCTHWRKRSG
jgi:threonine dehydrogenase-like Zn-dependent dehydrogenase